VAATLGDKTGMLLRGHGANVAEVNPRYASIMAVFMEEAARIQLQALAAVGGDPQRIQYYTEEEAALIREQQYSAGPMDRAWEYFSALADGEVRGPVPI
jgi:ribulose-5-phosphate 4-epimerase/fuculose-1-phosphate aldolase